MIGTVTSEATLEKLPVSTVLRDLNGDVFEKVAERGVEMTGVVGKFGLSWVKYPAEVLYNPCKHENTHMAGFTQVCDDCGQGREIG